MSVRLYVGNLPKEPVDREALHNIFTEVGEKITTKLIKDRKTGKCRGFAFVTVPTDEMADTFIEKFNGYSFMENNLKIEKALPRNKGKGAESETSSGENTEEASASKSETATAVATPTPAKSGSPKRKKGSNRNKNRNANQKKPGSVSDSIQPDPRWADELAILKERFAAQTANS